MARRKGNDPGRELLSFFHTHAQDAAKQALPQLETGEVLLTNDPIDGLVVQLDNMAVPASDCLVLSHYVPTVADRVIVLVHAEEFWVLGGITGDAVPYTAAGPPTGPAAGDLAGTYPNPTIKATVGLTGAPTAATAAPGTSTTQIASTAFVGAADTALTTALTASITLLLDPPGVIKPYAGPTAPTGYLICDGSSQLRGTYPNLFAVIGTDYGSVDGTHFNLPDARGRVLMGVGTGDAADATAHARADKLGTETHTLTLAQLPAHDHSPTANTLTSASTVSGTTDFNAAANTGVGSAHSHGVTDPTHSHDPIGSVTYHLGTGGITNRISGSLSGGGGVTTISSPAILTNNATGISIQNESAHVHASPQHQHTFTAQGSHTHTLLSQGSGASHNNLMPFLVVNYIIKT